MHTRNGSPARGLARRRLARVALVGCSLALAPLTACSSMTRGPLVALDKTAGTYREAELVYEVPLGKLGLGPVVPHYEGQLVAYQPLPTAPPGTRCGARLEVEYPHPDGRSDVGKVRLTIRTARQRSASAATAAAGTQADPSGGLSFTETIESMPVVGDLLVSGPKATETWEWDAPKSQIDRLLADLAYHGYFDRLNLPNQVADIDARIDGRRVARSWQRIPSFESFMQEARHYGRLVAYESSDESPVPGVDGTTAVLALNRQINARAGSRTILPPGAAPIGRQMIVSAPPVTTPTTLPTGYSYPPQSTPMPMPYAPPAAAPAPAATTARVLTQQPLRTQKLR